MKTRATKRRCPGLESLEGRALLTPVLTTGHSPSLQSHPGRWLTAPVVVHRTRPHARHHLSGTRGTVHPMGIAYTGPSGTVVTALSAKNDSALAVAIQSDGKIIAAGAVQGSPSDVGLARYNPDGSLDATFGNGGKVITAFSSAGDVAKAVMIQGDGRIVIAGWTTSAKTGLKSILVARYNPNGTLDTTFGNKGSVQTTVGTTSTQGYSALIQPDGRIVVAALSIQPQTNKTSVSYRGVVARYNPNGSLDTTFGSGGIASWAVPNNSMIQAIRLQGTSLIVGGAIFDPLGGYDLQIARLTAMGQLDATFGSGGVLDTQIFASTERLAMTVLADGRIVAATEAYDSTLGTGYDAAVVVRYNPDGSLDTSFGGAGIVSITYPTGNGLISAAVLAQADGKLVVSGASETGPPSFVGLRLNPDGSLDTTYGSGGWVTTSFGYQSGAIASALQGDGKVVAVGSVVPGTYADFALVRYNPDGSLDTTF